MLKTRTFLVQTFQGSLNRELALTANPWGQKFTLCFKHLNMLQISPQKLCNISRYLTTQHCSVYVVNSVCASSHIPVSKAGLANGLHGHRPRGPCAPWAQQASASTQKKKKNYTLSYFETDYYHHYYPLAPDVTVDRQPTRHPIPKLLQAIPRLQQWLHWGSPSVSSRRTINSPPNAALNHWQLI